MAIAGLAVGVLGTLVSVFAVFYAAQAARRSDALLRRLVIYPFRELDTTFAALNDEERRGLLALYHGTSEGRQSVDPAVVTAAKTQVPALSPMMLDFLAGQNWLERADGSGYRLNRDRLPYLHFVTESEGRAPDARP